MNPEETEDEAISQVSGFLQECRNPSGRTPEFFFLPMLPDVWSSLNKKLASEMSLSKQTGYFKAQTILVWYVLEIQKDLEGLLIW